MVQIYFNGPQHEAHKRTLVSELTHKCDYIEKLYSEYMSGLEHGSSTETLDVSPTGCPEPVQICVECYCKNAPEQCTCEPLRISLKRRSCVQVTWSLTDQEESEEIQKDARTCMILRSKRIKEWLIHYTSNGYVIILITLLVVYESQWWINKI
jgi:hypothetical protein